MPSKEYTNRPDHTEGVQLNYDGAVHFLLHADHKVVQVLHDHMHAKLHSRPWKRKGHKPDHNKAHHKTPASVTRSTGVHAFQRWLDWVHPGDEKAANQLVALHATAHWRLT